MPRRPKDSPPLDPQQRIDELQRENERLREDMRRSEIERNRLRRENARLKEELEMARRRATRQAAPFSRGVPKEHPDRPGQAGRRVWAHGTSSIAGPRRCHP